MTLEDVLHILCLPIHGEPIFYDPNHGLATLRRVFVDNDLTLGVEDYEIQWDTLVDLYDQLIVMICTVIDGIIPDH